MGYYEDRQEQRRREQHEEQRRSAERLEEARWRRNLCPCGLTQMVGGQCNMSTCRPGSGPEDAQLTTPTTSPITGDPGGDDWRSWQDTSRAAGEQATSRYDPPADPQAWRAEVVEARKEVAQSGEVERLWERAITGCEDEQQQLRRYWMLINEEQGADATRARELLVRAGYELGRESQPGRIRDSVAELERYLCTDGAGGDGPVEFHPWCVGCGGFLTSVGGLCLGCARQAAAALNPSAQGDSEGSRREDSRRDDAQFAERRVRGRELSNLCMNLDGPSVVGRLCSSCAAQLRLEENASARYQQAFSRPFEMTPELRTLWLRSSLTNKGEPRTYKKARETFWDLVSTSPARDARFVRGMLQAGGFDIVPGGAPALRLDTGDARKGRNRADRVLELDHASPQSADAARASQGLPPLALAADNIRFTLGWDNAVRGDRWTEDDTPVAGWPAFWESQKRRVWRRGRR